MVHWKAEAGPAVSRRHFQTNRELQRIPSVEESFQATVLCQDQAPGQCHGTAMAVLR